MSENKTTTKQKITPQFRATALLVVMLLVGSWVIQTVPFARSAGIDTSSITVTLASETVSASSQVDVTFTFGTLNDGDTVRIYLGEVSGGDPWDMTGVLTSDVICSDNGTSESYTTNSVNAATATVPAYVQCTATTVGGGATAVTVQIGDVNDPTNPAGADGYSVSIVTSNDSGAAIAYVGNGNDITVTAQVLPNLTLTIDNADASVCTTASGVTSCDLGVLTTGAVTTGNYDVNVGTNADNGATMRIAEDGDLRSGALTIADVTEDTTVSAGTEGYGIAVTADGSWTEQGDFNDDDTPIPSGPTAVAATAGPIAASGDDVTITHRAAVASSTEAASYSHIVTWTAIADF